MCIVAVFQSSDPRSIVSQSRKPVVAVTTVVIRPKSSASHQPCVAAFVLMPVTSASAATVANV